MEHRPLVAYASFSILAGVLGLMPACTTSHLSYTSPHCTGPCGRPRYVNVRFRISIDGISNSDRHAIRITAGIRESVAISVDVPQGAVVSDLEIGTGQSSWGIGNGGPTGALVVLVTVRKALLGGAHMLRAIWQVPASEAGTTTHLYAYYGVSPPRLSGQSFGYTVTQLGTVNVV